MGKPNNSATVEQRRRLVQSLLAQSTTEEEIALKLNVDQFTISRDILVLKKQSEQFVYDLAKSDLAYYYRQSIDGINEIKRKVWELYRSSNNDKTKLLALKLAKECNESVFGLFSQGPSVMNIRALEDRINRIESSSSTTDRQVSQ